MGSHVLAEEFCADNLLRVNTCFGQYTISWYFVPLERSKYYFYVLILVFTFLNLEYTMAWHSSHGVTRAGCWLQYSPHPDLPPASRQWASLLLLIRNQTAYMGPVLDMAPLISQWHWQLLKTKPAFDKLNQTMSMASAQSAFLWYDGARHGIGPSCLKS